MKAPPRLIDGSDPIVASMLRAARHEPPHPSGIANVLDAIASSGAAGTTGVATTSVGIVPLLKSAAIGVIAGAVVLGGIHASSPSAGHARKESASARLTRTSALGRAHAPTRALAVSTRDSTIDEAPASSEAPIAPGHATPGAGSSAAARGRRHSAEERVRSTESGEPKSKASSNAPSKQASRLAEEVVLIDRARSALSRGDARAMLESLRAYSLRFPTGALEPEAQYLRMEAHVFLGNTSAAKMDARAVLLAHPTGVHAKRAREILGSAE